MTCLAQPRRARAKAPGTAPEGRWYRDIRRVELDGMAARKARYGGSFEVTVGIQLVARFPARVGLGRVVRHLAAWWCDPGHLASLGHPVALSPWWRFDPGEQLCVFCAGRVVALVGLDADGRPVTTRFD